MKETWKHWDIWQRMFVLLLLPAFLTNIGYLALFGDEAIRAIIAMDFEKHGNWLFPQLNGLPYYNKPPLYNWLLTGFFVLFNSHKEWVIRLPMILSLLLFFFMIVKVVFKQTQHRDHAFWSGAFFITSGHILVLGSLLGHIDLFFSLLTFLQIYLIYYYYNKNSKVLLFVLTYFICALGFLQKGLPSLVFQGFSLLGFFLWKKQFKELFSWRHFLGIAILLLTLAAYYIPYFQTVDVNEYLETLVYQSTKRTVADKSLGESIGHLFEFPFRLALDYFPWFLILIPFLWDLKKSYTSLSQFSQFSLLMFLVNIPVYWLSPEYRARYVFMLIPFLFIALAEYAYFNLRPLGNKAIHKISFNVVAVLSLIFVVGSFFLFKEVIIQNHIISLVVLIAFWLFSFYYYKKTYSYTFWFAFLLILKLIFNLIVIPERSHLSMSEEDKKVGIEIGKIIQDEPTYLYYSNLELGSAYYALINRNNNITSIFDEHRDTLNRKAFFIVPCEQINDYNNVENYYQFTRKYESLDFMLVKFKHYLPRPISNKR